MNLNDQPSIIELPEWDLTDLCLRPFDENTKIALDDLEIKTRNFYTLYHSKIIDLDCNSLFKSLKEFESINEKLLRVASFVFLHQVTDATSVERKTLLQEVKERTININNNLMFYTIEINKIPSTQLENLLNANSELNQYKTWFEQVRLWKDYTLSEVEEKILLEKSLTSSTALISFYDQHLTKLKFKIDNEDRTLEETLEKLDSPNSEIRKAAAIEIGNVLARNSDIFTYITNTLIKDKEIEDKLRGFRDPRSSRDLSNQIDSNVVDSLVSAVKKNYPNISHRYYKLKARLLSKEKLEYWDIYAPVVLGSTEENISWDEAKKIILQSYQEFSLEFKKIAASFFDNNWIDAKLAPFKQGGAFAHPASPSVHPYIMVNYHNNFQSVTTLAHELGHGIHQVLAGKQGALMCSTPLTLAETASVFGEQLVFQNLLKNEQNKQKKIQLIAKKIESMIGTVIRQISFHEFEKQIHEQRKNGELTTEQITEIWHLKLKESLGESVNIDPNCQNYWMYIPHFIHSPFYVYAYAFGDCLVNSLYSVYKKESIDNFEEKYTNMLTLGGQFSYKDLLPIFGLDASKEDFWQEGLNAIINLIDELEELCS